MDIANRIAGLRMLMKENQIDAYLLTGADPHLSEYTPDNWKTREWISGFTGSYGKVLVTMERALLWTDTRYFLQATKEISGTGIELMKERVPDAITLEDWLSGNLIPENTFAVDGSTISMLEAAQLESKLAAKGVLFRTDIDLVDQIWLDRPIKIVQQAYDYLLEYAVKSRAEKFEMVRKELLAKNLDSIVVAALDDLAWLFNLRGDEIQYTPLVTAYGYLDQENIWLFIHPDKLSAVFRDILEKEGIIIQSYSSFYQFLSRLKNNRIQIDPVRTNSLISGTVYADNFIESSVAVPTLLKAVKETNITDRIKAAHIKDGAAMVYSLFWLHQTIGREKISEVSVGQKLNEFRSKQPLFKGDSFHPIVGFGPHGAIVHYHATDQTDTEILLDNLLLIDSGGQYLDGTTDITRTIATGNVAQNQKEDFTICLKAHIALATAIFPTGTKGHSLDSITRKPLWDRGINYGHGTGHGIGYFLSVHEGPMSIRAEFNNEPIREGHLLSNEPGIYREGQYGIRIENVIICKKHGSTEFGDFLCFETISLCPIDKQLIVVQLLTADEIKWVNHYHETVLQKISPIITDSNVLEWLKKQCEPIH